MLPIVLIHGFPFDGAMWQAQAEYLRSPAGGERTVLTPDLAGFGESPSAAAPGAGEASVEAYAQQIHRVIEEYARSNGMASAQAIVGGFSLGGYVVLSLLRQFPGDVAAAMLIDTRADADSPEGRAARQQSIEEIQKNGTGGICHAMLLRLVRTNAPPEVKQRVRGIMAKQSAAAMIAAQSAMAKRRDQTDLLPALAIPVLIVVGAEDAITPPSLPLAMQSHIPHAMLVQIAAAGHMTPMEQPESVNSAIGSFLATLQR